MMLIQKHRLLVSLMLFLGCLSRLHAEEAPAHTADGRGRSVYRIVPVVDGPVLGVAVAGAVVPLFIESSLVQPQCPCNPNDVNSLDRHVIGNHSSAAAWGSHFLVSLAIATPPALDIKDQGWNKTLAEDLIVYAEVLSIDSSINNLARYTAQRPRPETYSENPPPQDPGSYLSFDAGHVASTVSALSAASMTYGYRYGKWGWPWVITGTAGLTEAYLRSAAGKHFYTDDMVGIAVGTTVGTVIPWLHHRHQPLALTLAPIPDGALLTWHHAF